MPEPDASEVPSTVDDRAQLRQEVLEAVAALWWVPLVRGVLLIALGGYALLMPGLTLTAYMVVIGVFVLLDGILAIVAGLFGWVESRGWAIARGVIGILIGLYVLAHPAIVGVVAVWILVLLLAAQSIVCGVLEIVTAVRERQEIEGEWWLVLGGLLSIAFGVILLSWQQIAAVMLIQVLGAFAIIAGVVLIVAAFKLRKFGSTKPE